jgi:hypothetical protein
VTEDPQASELRTRHRVACHFAEELLHTTRRDELVRDAAAASSPLLTTPDEAIAPVTPPEQGSGDTGSLFDPGDELH